MLFRSLGNTSPWNYSYNAGVYTVTLIVTNNQGCTDTISTNIIVYDELTIPNVFSPNGDGINDFFEIEALKPNSPLTILNRWGNVVFTTTNYQNNWDGTDQNGATLTEGVYTVLLTNNGDQTTHFFVHIIR